MADGRLVERLAREFSAALRRELTAEEMDEAVRLNAAEPAGSDCCHTHDHIDANMSMVQAFEAVVGREPFGEEEGPDDADLDLINEAWALASLNGFYRPR